MHEPCYMYNCNLNQPMTVQQYKRQSLCLEWCLKITSQLAGKTRVVMSELNKMAASVVHPRRDGRSWIDRGVPKNCDVSVSVDKRRFESQRLPTEASLAQGSSALVKSVPECHTAWIRVKRRITRRHNRVQCVCLFSKYYNTFGAFKSTYSKYLPLHLSIARMNALTEQYKHNEWWFCFILWYSHAHY